MVKDPKYQKFVKLFEKKSDPWSFSTSAFEKARFDKMLTLAKVVPHQKILEVVCAEGHFTKKLLTISRDVTAIDVSKEALVGAKKRAPGAKFVQTSIDDYDLNRKKFDLVVASEVVYYIADKKPIFDKIKKCANYLLMSNVGVWDYLLAIHLKDAKLVKRTHHSRFSEGLRYFCAISLWQLNL